MANMSYCRFENTYRDLRDCAEHISDALTSREEKTARLRLIECCKEILDNVDIEVDLNGQPTFHDGEDDEN